MTICRCFGVVAHKRNRRHPLGAGECATPVADTRNVRVPPPNWKPGFFSRLGNVPEELTFLELVRRVRAGDEAASAELVLRYEPAIRIAVRGRLTDPGLRRLCDSMDICQSVLANFFVRAAAGEFELHKPEQLIRLLATMARNRVTDHALKQQAARRDYRRIDRCADHADNLVDVGLSPSDEVSLNELLQAFQGRLSAEERYLADQRALGRPWAQIAAEVGDKADVLRVRLQRAINRVTRELRLN
jgi:RNA polymerase sigma-70 factor (ECF subfamily)